MAGLRVGLDTSALDPAFKEHAQRGIGRYVRELKAFFDVHQMPPPVSVGYFDHTHFRAGAVVDRLIRCAPLGKETIRQQLVYPIKLSQGSQRGFDVLHFPAQMDAPSWSPMPYLITVLDLIPVVCRELYETAQTSWRFRLARWLELRAIQNAQRVLVISRNTGDDVHRLLGVPWERISITPLGVNRGFFREVSSQQIQELSSRLEIDSSRPAILYVGGIDQRKNIPFMLRVLARLRDECGAAGKVQPQLLLAGTIQKDRQYPLIRSLIADLKLENSVRELGFISDQDLPVLYRICSLFFFPSLYEGFGLPPLEALATGIPVVSSNTSAMPEVLGECADYVAPDDVAGAVETIFRRLFVIADTVEERQRRQLQAAAFTWEKTGASTLAAYESYAQRYQDPGISGGLMTAQGERR